MKKIARLLSAILVSAVVSNAKAHGFQIIDFQAIAELESSNNPKAFNKKSGAIGLFQITPVCLKDFNEQNKKKYTAEMLYSPYRNFEVANWYLTVRIPQMLEGLGLEITTQRILWAWNAGIWAVIHDRMPNETRLFINKYNKIAR